MTFRSTILMALTLGAFGAPVGFLAFLGLTGILAGIGMAATRWVFGFEAISQTAMAEMQGENQRSQTVNLDRLEQDLKVDRDSRTAQSVQDLRRLYRRLDKAGVMGNQTDCPVLPEIKAKAEQLYQSCLDSLARTLEFWRAAQEMATQEGRKQMLDARESLIAEVGKSVYHLGKTVDHLQASMLKRDRQDDSLARMRQELDMGLEVAQRIEQRMDQLNRLGQEAPPIADSDKPSSDGKQPG